MAKEVAVGKRLKISKAEEYMILAVLGASVLLGAAISLVIRFTKQIAFNASVIAAEEQSVVAYSDVIKTTGVCKKPKGSIYSDDELKKCDPASLKTSDIPGTLRANIINNLSVNDDLNSVTKQIDSTCTNPLTNKNYTLDELNKRYNAATTKDDIASAFNLLKSCSALRIIPDSLPRVRNEEALLASLNKIFIVSGWIPQTLRPDESDDAPAISSSLNTIPVSFHIETSSGTTMRSLKNIERSIRNFNIYRATLEWGSGDTMILQARAAAYYVDPSMINESTVIVSGKTGEILNPTSNKKGGKK